MGRSLVLAGLTALDANLPSADESELYACLAGAIAGVPPEASGRLTVDFLAPAGRRVGRWTRPIRLEMGVVAESTGG